MNRSWHASAMREVYIVDAVRTPIGRHRGCLAPVRPDDLLAHVLRASVERTSLDPGGIDEAIMGCANQAGEDNRNVARMAVLLAELPDSIPAITVNRLCASGLSAINQAARQIACGEADVVLAGGVESMSRAPLVLGKGAEAWARGNQTAYDTSLGWRFPNPKMEAMFPLEAMGETAENVAERYGVSREDQDSFAAESHRRALAAEEAGRFHAERVRVKIPQRRGDELVVERDEGPRGDARLDKLAGLRAVFRTGGSVTAGNSSSLNDGAASVVLASKEGLARMKKEPMARWVGSASAGVDPRVMGIGPVPAVRKLLQRTGTDLSKIDLVELNEAFAAQSLAVLRELQLTHRMADINPNGGAIALGHPLGMSGARIMTTLLFEMERRQAQHGIATLCVGVGQGVATQITRLT
ncbi:MAG TPA: acetyl-CoA C-acyltransferase [Myxococcales bacterium LLY-WYZ-16_1]|nr:acetyl-CoA C-acyltransferase [Myxococcales bacterium LLY-WYZ-16_1]